MKKKLKIVGMCCSAAIVVAGLIYFLAPKKRYIYVRR